jgi:hypothetical protein
MAVVAILMSLLVAVAWYRVVPWYAPAFVGSVVTSVFLIWLVTMSHFGWTDETFCRNLVTSLALAAVPALLVGIYFQWRRTKR